MPTLLTRALTVALLLTMSGCANAPPVEKETGPAAQPQPKPGTIYLPDNVSKPIGLDNIPYTDEDSVRYAGYEVHKATKQVLQDSANPGTYVDVEYAILKRYGKMVATFDAHPDNFSRVRFALFPFLGGKDKQLVIEQTSLRFWQYWIIRLSPQFERIYDSGRYNLLDDLTTTDVDGDGRYEIVQSLATFWFWRTLSNADSPRPPVIFKYDLNARKYIPASSEFQNVLLGDIETRINLVRQRRSEPATYGFRETLGGFIDIVIRYLYAGQVVKAWDAFDREYFITENDKPLLVGDPVYSLDKELIRTGIIDRLNHDALYKEIQRVAQRRQSLRGVRH